MFLSNNNNNNNNNKYMLEPESTISWSLSEFENNINIINRVLNKLVDKINNAIREIKENINYQNYHQNFDDNFDDAAWLNKLQEIPDYLDTVKIKKAINVEKAINAEEIILVLKYISDARNKVSSCKLYREYYLLNKAYLIKYGEYYKKLLDNAHLRLYANLDDLGKPEFKTHYDNLSAFYKKEELKKMVQEFENENDVNPCSPMMRHRRTLSNDSGWMSFEIKK